jgi:PrtD family type I secretion system ABC transporter
VGRLSGSDSADRSPSPIAAALSACRGAFVAVGHGAGNVLARAGRVSGSDAAARSPSPIAAALSACRGAFVAMGHGAINRLAKPGRSSGSDAAGRSSSPIASALSACRGGFVAVGLFSGAINVLMLTGSVYMLQIYDRVLPSRSVPTLVSLTIIVIAVYGILGFMDAIRGRMLVRIGRSLDEAMGARVYEAVVRLPLKMRSSADGLQPIRDLDQLRGFLSSLGPTALFDLPWMPLYLGLCFAFHFWIGTAALAGAIVLVTLTFVTELLARAPAKAATMHGANRLVLAETSRRNAEAVEAMAMTPRLAARWDAANMGYMDAHQRASDVAATLGAFSRVLRMMLQSGVMAVGAYLVIYQEATPGVIIAGSILTSRALAPVDLAIAHWRGFVGARQSWARLSKLVGQLAVEREPMALPAPSKSITVEALSVAPPGLQNLVVRDVAFRVEAGQALGIIGPSASGKSSLARALVAVWRPARGKVRIDGAALEQWPDLGTHIGYLPQDVELFDGTVAENIARFEPDHDPAAVVAAAQAADMHELIVRFPDGYDTAIGEGGMALSAGQRQRVALARALYRDPFLVVLDEPNSNLDAEGDEALTQAIAGVRKRMGILIVIAHRPSALTAVDLVLAMANGQAQAFGPKEEVLRKVLRPAAKPSALKVVSESSVPVS